MSAKTPEEHFPDVEYNWNWTEADADWVPPTIDTSKPSPARIYDHFLGGKDNFAVDRSTAAVIEKVAPDAAATARANRGFLVRAVTAMANDHGIRQFIDIGTGIPTEPSVHTVAHELAPAARVVYVDNDPVVLAHSRAMLSTETATATVLHDLRTPSEVLGDPLIRQVIDFSQPVGFLFVAVLHFVGIDQAPGILAQYRRAAAPGSCVAISAACREGSSPQGIRTIEDLYRNATAQVHFRTRAQIEELFEGYDVTPPGLADITQWRNPEGKPFSVHALAGLGVRS